MNKLFIVFLLSFSIAGCLSKSEDPNAKLKEDLAKIDRDMQTQNAETDRLMAQMKRNFEKGGQPGNVRLFGAIIDNNVKINDRISVSLEGGIGKDGNRALLEEKSKVKVFSAPLNAGDFSEALQKRTFISINCDERIANRYARMHSLRRLSTPDLNASVISVIANTVLLCGDLTLSATSANFAAETMIFYKFNYQHIMLGASNFFTHNLILKEKNKIMMTGMPSDMPLWSTDLTLTVVKHFDAGTDGSLRIKSVGSNYITPKSR